MLFAAPLMLIGLGALALPVVIHLLDRSRAPAQDWPTLRFLKVARQQSSRRSRLKNIVVLLTRCLLLALVVLAMARPFTSSESFSKPPDLPATLVVVIDNSYSMGYVEAGSDQSRLERAKRLAADMVSQLGAKDESALVIGNEAVLTPMDRPTRDHQAVAKLIREIKLSNRGTDLASALTTAFSLGAGDARVEESEPTPGTRTGSRNTTGAATQPARAAWRQVIVFTDMQRSGWRGITDGNLLTNAAQPLPVTVVDITSGESANRFIKRATARQVGGGNLAMDVEIVGQAGSGVTGAGQGQATLMINGLPVGTPELIPAGAGSGGAKILLRAPMPAAGGHACMVAITDDRLALDDKHHLALQVTAARGLTIVDGDPSEIPSLSGTYFLEAALGHSRARQVAPSIARLSPSQLSSATLDPGSAVALVNVPSLDGSALTRLENFLRAGGSVWIVLGDKVDVDHYNRDWRFLPIKLDRTLGDPARARSYAIQIDAPQHPIFGEQIDLSASRFFSLVGADPTSIRAGGKVLASFSNGSPALIEGTYGSAANTTSEESTRGNSAAASAGATGRVLLFTTSLDARWSNLPFRRVFVPFIDRTAAYLTQARITARSVALGQPIRFTGPTTLNGRTIVITAPDATSQTLTATIDPALGKDVVSAEYRGTWQTGFYRVQADEGFATGSGFAVNLDTRESLITAQDVEALKAAFAEHPLRLVKSPPRDVAGWNPLSTDQRETRTEDYAKWLLLAALATFVIESILANYFTRRRRAQPPPVTEYMGRRRADAITGTAPLDATILDSESGARL